jgi:hypothetical protein
MKQRLASTRMKLEEDFEAILTLNTFIVFDEGGYLF